jgi:hypothetical protein
VGAQTLEARLQNGSSEAYRLLDITGRLRAQGHLQSGQVALGPLVPGVYILQVMVSSGTVNAKMVLP